jgi:pimeloyl-ACP methyl ester carboxylesterase
VRALILEAPHVFVEDKTIAAIAALPAQPDLVERLGRHHADPRRTFEGWTRMWLAPELRAWNIEACLPRVRAPTLVIQGEDDEYGTLAQVDAVMAQIGGPCTKVIERDDWISCDFARDAGSRENRSDFVYTA